MRVQPSGSSLPAAAASGAAAAALLLAACGPAAVAVRHTTGQASGSRTGLSVTVQRANHHRRSHRARRATRTTSTLRLSGTTATTAAVTTTTTVPAPVSVSGGVTAVGDSVMLDAAPALRQDIPGIDVEANVSEQWYQGVQEVRLLGSEGRLGSVVVVALGTNGPISQADLAAMMQACRGASRVVFVTNHVPDWWQNPNNAVIESAPSQFRSAAVANWEAIAAKNPGWFYGDGTHMPIGGTGAAAYAALVASKI